MKILITENTVVNVGDDRGGVHAAEGDLLDVPAAVARQLVQCGRALYTVRKDDTDKSGSNTAPADVVSAAEELARERAKPASPEGGKKGKEGE